MMPLSLLLIPTTRRRGSQCLCPGCPSHGATLPRNNLSSTFANALMTSQRFLKIILGATCPSVTAEAPPFLTRRRSMLTAFMFDLWQHGFHIVSSHITCHHALAARARTQWTQMTQNGLRIPKFYMALARIVVLTRSAAGATSAVVHSRRGTKQR